MRTSNRLICASCLESVEASIGEDGRMPAFCASCGCPIEAGNDDTPRTNPTGEYPQPLPIESADAVPHVDRRQGAVPGLPTRIGRFRVIDWLGGGGYGEVYLALDPRLGREVALKVLKLTKLDVKATERFLREARAAARLDHPMIVNLHEAGEDDGRLWIAYQLVRGRTLSQLRDARSLDLNGAVRLVRDLALALAHAHGRGVYHRDLKPANVLVDDSGTPRLTDFGLARRIDLLSDLTGEGTVLGTPKYMSPEQAAGRANVADGRSDIYSLGVILYELICGRTPNDLPSTTPPWKVRSETPPSPRSVDRSIPQSLGRICLKAMALNPDDRYADATSFAAALDAWLALHPVPRHRRPRGALLAAGTVLTVLTALTLRNPSVALPPVVQTPVTIPDDPTPAPITPTIVSPTPEALDIPVVVNVNKRKIHVDGCPQMKQMNESNRRVFASLTEAEQAGYTDKCMICASKMAAR